MNRVLPALFAIAALLECAPVQAVPPGHCAPARVTAVTGDPGAYRIETAHGVTLARRPAPQANLTPPTAVFRVYRGFFDFDGDTISTIRDTIVVIQGSTVAWIQYQQDFHTVTNGTDSGDLSAASEFNAILDGINTRFDWTYTTPGKHDFFCFIHEPVMLGTVFVIPATLDVKPGVIRKAAFTRLPAPNPTRGQVSFAIAMPRTAAVLLTVHDIAGRAIATIHDGALPPGEHRFQWNGRSTSGRAVESGRYFIRMATGEGQDTRAVTLVR